MKVNTYDFLSEDAEKIRKSVFINEQGFLNEFDDVDNRATHIVMYNDSEEPVATCRIFEGVEKDTFIFGRLAVIKEYRGNNIGAKMIMEAERLVMKKSGKSISLHAQCRVKDFYNKLGFLEYGDVEDDEGCPHIWMKKQF